MRSLGWLFDIGKSTACQIVNDVCKAIVDVLLPKVIKWPTGEALKSVLNGFAEEWKFPQCAGAIDGTHKNCCSIRLPVKLLQQEVFSLNYNASCSGSCIQVSIPMKVHSDL